MRRSDDGSGHGLKIVIFYTAKFGVLGSLLHKYLCYLEHKGDGFTYLLTPWSRVLLEKLTGLQLDKKFPAFYGTRRFITALTSARHLSLS